MFCDMTRSIRASLAFLLALVVLIPANAANDLPRVILISIDGLMPSTYTTASPARIPTLRRLLSQGVHADGVLGVMPSVTYPSHTTLITGVVPAVHGVYDNRILDPEGRSREAWYWYASDIQVPTLPQAARSRGLRAAAISWPATIGMDVDYLVPEFWRSNHPESLKLLKALSWPRDLIEAAEITQGSPFAWPHTDRHRTDIARFLIRTHQPHVLLLHLLELDGIQHELGPETPQSLETLERLDGYVGEILDTLKTSGLADRTTVAVVSDHGFLGFDRQVQPNAAFKREGLITVNESGAITAWQAYYHSSGGSGFVFLKDPRDAALEARVADILRKLQADPANGIRKVWNAKELVAMGARPDASFALDVVDGFYSGQAHNALVVPSTSKGGHGYDPARPGLQSSFIAAGPAIERRGTVGRIRMTQVAPTLARILGVGLSPRADQPLPVGSNLP
jgi:predicted AlkP superfamily pyrophosphatase or phosphodiesterase